MAVRLTTLFRREDERAGGAPAKRQGIGHELRNRFGFSLIQAPLRKTSSTWNTDLEVVPEQRRFRQPDLVRATRPLESQLELAGLLRGTRY
ncbi:hypothetical protein [Amycolatopsis sp. H20-H5]|uniref:hypothetical protein n=1 Tax=Amycolatopsis sp. H20-H5 TaxID=3046309 RepID=UPI002DBD50DB|nr:hypothetical protein [Amycolatopsis sp. H20-H5]MEC3975414.1 hypothetical protein [Amycolatopsis sp. H20-H5]